MQRLFALILVLSLWFGVNLTTAQPAYAEFSFDTLTPCGSSQAFKDVIDKEIDGYTSRLASFAPNSAPAQYLKGKITAAQERYSKYSSSTLLCGSDGLPHIISDGRFDHAGEFLIPGLLFLYITGWIGWVGRDYLRAVRKDPSTATQKEIIIDVPLALRYALTGFTWPLAALKELGDGSLIASEKEVTVSPR
ncbi:Photosystem I reaction centre subunit III [Synechococcus sp. PCC 7502]|uniref:photosystem I reaction centre subunit III n=1 Tax=Synechococcus sp. PCC 7502 TaxID=1173263 RepID=UPI00029FDE89|nr:photosystem I reaction centre subunit III [Synechococcus sp. PCC 7502]AFY74888.1 Photosystem I reaction centre subunit III [Synechococcus sp. PCC 7502]